MELLAPAGSYDAFLAAVENGADAIYLGGKLFNARANASNFSLEELKNMVTYAHLRNVKIHVTLNILLDDKEIAEALNFAYDLYHIGVDAVIVQDLGLAKVLHENIPDLPLHASTQMSIYDLAGVEALKKLGFSRVVLARELSLKEIQYICEHTDMEIEIFAHGALCVCYSGQCLMSSMIGDRSGNRGKCAQPCRMPYTLMKNDAPVGKGYLLSPKDLCTIDYLTSLPNVVSLKIEGRMKSPEYVATVVSHYRKVLDGDTPSSSDKNELMQVFNRGGFTDGYHYGKNGKDMMCYEKPKHWGIYIGKVTNYDGKRYIKIAMDNPATSLEIGDGIEIWNGENESPSTIISERTKDQFGRISGNIHVGDKVYKTYDKSLMQKAKESFSRGYVKKQMVNTTIDIALDSPIVVTINDFVYQSNIIPEKPQKNPISEEKIIEQFRKTGNTPFEIRELTIHMRDSVFLPISQINELRRNAFRMYEEYFLNTIKRKTLLQATLKHSKPIEFMDIPKEISLSAQHISEDLNLILPKVNQLYVPLKEALTKEDLFLKLECKKYIILPTITKNKYDALLKKNIQKLKNICDGFVLSSIGQLQYFDGIQTYLIANDTFNVFNSYTIDILKELGFKKVILSPELTLHQINAISSSLPTEFMAYGRQRVMTSEYCPIGSICGGLSKGKKCTMPCTKNDSYYLRDRLGLDFPVIPDNIDCQASIYNCKITSIESKNTHVSSLLIQVMNETVKEISSIIDVHKSGNKLNGEQYTNAHATRPV